MSFVDLIESEMIPKYYLSFAYTCPHAELQAVSALGQDKPFSPPRKSMPSAAASLYPMLSPLNIASDIKYSDGPRMAEEWRARRKTVTQARDHPPRHPCIKREQA